MQSNHGLLTTIAYQLGSDKPVCYALEGSVAVAGNLIKIILLTLLIITTLVRVNMISKINTSATYSSCIPFDCFYSIVFYIIQLFNQTLSKNHLTYP